MMQNRKLKIALLTILPGLMFFIAWPPRDLFFLSFVAFVPIFILEQETRGKKSFGLLAYSSLLIWNILTTWWVWYASPAGSIFMLLANSLLMLLPWLAYRKAVSSFGQKKAYLVFITVWLAFEYLHLNWQITWPWLTLGNVFAKYNFAVQWYEITGALGGSLWVLLVNTVAFESYKKGIKRSWKKLVAVIAVPLFVSAVFILLNKQVSYAKFETFETLIVQPNIDPYEKFNGGEEIKNLKEMLALVEPEITENTKYVIMPETAVVEYVDEDAPMSYESIRILKAFVRSHPNIHLITGISTYNFYDRFEERDATARQTQNGQYYESYNTAMELDSSGKIQLYHKSKLVPGVEKMPYPEVFGFMEKLSIDMGGISGSLGSDKEATVFQAGDKPDVAPLICYESVFPGYVSEFVRKGSEIILVITNDGWWRNTDGYKQHMYYATLRAIENRREVLRSANTGISCRIDRNGKILERTEWWEPKVLKVDANNHARKTVYTKLGDYIGRIASFIAVFFLLGLFVKRKTDEISD
jgi:apolipoprotein N-acyltransferase